MAELIIIFRRTTTTPILLLPTESLKEMPLTFYATYNLIVSECLQLWKFKQVCQCCNLQVDFNKYTLTGDIQKEEIDLAVKEYDAKVLEPA